MIWLALGNRVSLWPDRQAPLRKHCPLVCLKWVLEPPAPTQASGRDPLASTSLVHSPQPATHTFCKSWSEQVGKHCCRGLSADLWLQRQEVKGTDSLWNGHEAPRGPPRDQATPKAALSTDSNAGRPAAILPRKKNNLKGPKELLQWG